MSSATWPSRSTRWGGAGRLQDDTVLTALGCSACNQRVKHFNCCQLVLSLSSCGTTLRHGRVRLRPPCREPVGQRRAQRRGGQVEDEHLAVLHRELPAVLCGKVTAFSLGGDGRDLPELRTTYQARCEQVQQTHQHRPRIHRGREPGEHGPRTEDGEAHGIPKRPDRPAPRHSRRCTGVPRHWRSRGQGSFHFHCADQITSFPFGKSHSPLLCAFDQ